MGYVYVMHPGNRLRELRKRAKLTQKDLADAAGLTQAAISQIENDTRPLTVDWMRTFARVLKCKPADFLSDEDNPGRLSPEEQALIEQFRAASHDQQAMIQRVAEPMQGYRAQANDRAA